MGFVDLTSGAGLAEQAPRPQRAKLAYSKRLVSDIRALLWVVTVGGLALAGLCIWRGYVGSLPWLSAMVGLPWSAHGVVCASYLSLCKSDHKQGGITYDAAKAVGFRQSEDGRWSENGSDGSRSDDRQRVGSIDSPVI